jgi:acetolactate synthase-1/2/3 large subunit
VVCLCGDGAFGLNGMEIDTAVRHDLPIVVVIQNNQGWGGRWIPLGVRHYEQVAAGLGGYGEFVERPEQIRPALERAFASGKAACINVMVDPDAPRWGRRAAAEE